MATLNLRNPNGYDGQPGTQYKQGIVRFATAAEVASGANNVALTPADAAGAVPYATTTTPGLITLATNAEAVTGTDALKAITPASLTARLAAPGAIGGTTPAAGTFTTLTATNLVVNTLISYNGGAATDFIGTATLVNGTVDIANTNIAATDRIFLSHEAVNASTEVGVLQYTIDPGVDFTINSLDPTDATVATGDLSDISYVIIRQV